MALFSTARDTSHAGTRVHLQRDALAQEGMQGLGVRTSLVQRYGLGCVNGRQTQAGRSQGLDKTPLETQARGPVGSAKELGKSQEKGRNWEEGSGSLGWGKGLLHTSACWEPTHIHVPSWDQWPQTRLAIPEAATSFLCQRLKGRKSRLEVTCSKWGPATGGTGSSLFSHAGCIQVVYAPGQTRRNLGRSDSPC